MREGAECFGGRDFERGKEIGEGVLGGFVPKQRERERDGGGVDMWWRKMGEGAGTALKEKGVRLRVSGGAT
jgi:hypothetical protein